MPAHGMAGHDHALPAQAIHHPSQVRGELLRPVPGIGRPATLSVPPLVEGDDVEPVNEGRHHGVEPVGMGRAAVEEAERRPAALPPLQSVQRNAVDHE